jgi:Raf kinase inhibitor-like YbhB/YbcL family protein
MSLEIRSSAFSEGGSIPAQYTCDGKDVSPPLSWSGAPEGTKAFALVCDDPDARGWVHWVIYDLPASLSGLPEAVPTHERVAEGGRQGTNDFRKTGYGGPCPPSGTHRYVFTLYALDSDLKLAGGATKAQLTGAVRGHVLAEGRLTGKYSRR